MADPETDPTGVLGTVQRADQMETPVTISGEFEVDVSLVALATLTVGSTMVRGGVLGTMPLVISMTVLVGIPVVSPRKLAATGPEIGPLSLSIQAAGIGSGSY